MTFSPTEEASVTSYLRLTDPNNDGLSLSALRPAFGKVNLQYVSAKLEAMVEAGKLNRTRILGMRGKGGYHLYSLKGGE